MGREDEHFLHPAELSQSKSENRPVSRGDFEPCLSVQGDLVTPMGFEPMSPP
jgi:hypothetical protein